jgi:hypothetical protein
LTLWKNKVPNFKKLYKTIRNASPDAWP